LFTGMMAGLDHACAADPANWSWAETPPMGWNSWDGFATTVTEAQTRAQADMMKAKLASHVPTPLTNFSRASKPHEIVMPTSLAWVAIVLRSN
jgi:hypothetical protein